MVQATSSREEKKSSRKRPRFWMFVLLGVCLLFGALYSFWIFLQRPAIGEIRIVEPAPTEEIKVNTKPKQYQGTYLTFSYPGIYGEKSHTLPVSGPVKESVFLSAGDFEGRKIAIVVEDREEKNFEASPSFQMRLDKPKIYEKSAFSENDFEGFLFTKNSQVFEQTAFFFARDLFISISLTSPITMDGLKDDLAVLLKSIEIKK